MTWFCQRQHLLHSRRFTFKHFKNVADAYYKAFEPCIHYDY